ncbi:MAG: lysine--tRNA ligase, partial [Clostridia bacterium]|nr:lysine--tRNA ligase [Clostridia bacterium]
MSENNQNLQNTEPAQDYNELVKVRRDKLAGLKNDGKDPFQITKFDFDAYAADIKADYEKYEGKTVRIAGRMMSRRIMGKASFANVQDTNGNIQLYVSRNDIGDDNYAAFKKYDIGDIVGIEGVVFKTKTEEISIHTTSITLLSKSLLPLPEKFHGLKDTDTRFRQRYVDLIVNPDVKRNFIVRSQFIKFMRKYLDDMNYIEVETPVLNTI